MGIFKREIGRPTVKYRTLCHELCKNSWIDQAVIWIVDSDGKKEAYIRWGCALAPSGKYDWTIHVRRPCGLTLNDFDHLLLLLKNTISHWAELQLGSQTSMTNAGTFVLTTSEHLAADHRTWRTFTITALTHGTVAHSIPGELVTFVHWHQAHKNNTAVLSCKQL